MRANPTNVILQEFDDQTFFDNDDFHQSPSGPARHASSSSATNSARSNAAARGGSKASGGSVGKARGSVDIEMGRVGHIDEDDGEVEFDVQTDVVGQQQKQQQRSSTSSASASAVAVAGGGGGRNATSGGKPTGKSAGAESKRNNNNMSPTKGVTQHEDMDALHNLRPGRPGPASSGQQNESTDSSTPGGSNGGSNAGDASSRASGPSSISFVRTTSQPSTRTPSSSTTGNANADDSDAEFDAISELKIAPEELEKEMQNDGEVLIPL